MNPEAECLIDLATRPLADNAELRLSAEAELRKSLEAHAADRPEAVKEAADSLARADLRPKRARWWIALLVITALVSLPLLAHSILHFREVAKVPSYFTFGGIYSEQEPNIPNLTPQQRLLLFGQSGATNNSGKWKPLWESEPENLAYLSQYALVYYNDQKALSPEILAAAERLDPENAWFPALAAAGMAEGAVSKKSTPYAKGPMKTPVWIIHDEKRLNESLAAIHQLVGKTKMYDYQKDLLQRRAPLLPPRTDFVSQFPSLLYFNSLRSANISLRKLADALAAGAQQCAANGEVVGLRRIIADWQALVPLISKNGYTFLVDVLSAKSYYNSPSANFRDAARTLGMEKEESYFAKIHDRWQEEKDDRDKRRKSGNANEEFVSRHSSLMAGMTLPMVGNQVKNPPILTESDLRPGRYADHAVFERFCSWFGVLLLGFAAASASSFRYRQSPLARRLSVRMVDLFRPSDWGWVLLGGIVFPMLWYFCITRLTPLGAREWSARMSGFIQPGGQFGSMVLAMVILPVLIANRRLAERGAAMGLTGRFQGFGWVAVGAALLAVPAFGGLMLPSDIGRLFFWAAYVLLAIAAVWLLTGFAASIFGRESQALRRATLARIVWPVWVSGILALVVVIPIYYAEERYWVPKDRIFEISAEHPGPNQYEYEVTQILRAELLETLRQAGDIH